MGSGKSSVGKAVASSIGIPFLDLDDLISERAGKSIPEIFREDGEPAFRILEAGMLKEMMEMPGSAVIATGGGALLQPDAMKTVEATQSIVVLLDTRLDHIVKRVGRHSGRPLLDGEAKQKAEQLYMERMPAYLARADLVVGNNKPETVAGTAGKIVEALGF
jgi:shikimate kinase